MRALFFPFLAFLASFFILLFTKESSFANLVYFNTVLHSILMLVICTVIFYSAYFSYQIYKQSRQVSLFAVSLSLYVFGLVFLVHSMYISGFVEMSKEAFEVSEHYGLFLGSLVFFLLTVSFDKAKDFVFKNKTVILYCLLLAVAFFVVSMLIFDSVAVFLNQYIDYFVFLTAVSFLLLSIFSFRKFKQYKNKMYFYLSLGFAVLINAGVAPFLYEDWNIFWWYFHLIFLFGFLFVLFGLLKNSHLSLIEQKNE